MSVCQLSKPQNSKNYSLHLTNSFTVHQHTLIYWRARLKDFRVKKRNPQHRLLSWNDPTQHLSLCPALAAWAEGSSFFYPRILESSSLINQCALLAAPYRSSKLFLYMMLVGHVVLYFQFQKRLWNRKCLSIHYQ